MLKKEENLRLKCKMETRELTPENGNIVKHFRPLRPNPPGEVDETGHRKMSYRPIVTRMIMYIPIRIDAFAPHSGHRTTLNEQ